MFEAERVSADDIARRSSLFWGDEAETAVVGVGHQNHALALDASQLARGEVDQERDLSTDNFFWGEVLGDATDDGAGVEACVDGKLQELVGFGDFFALEDGADPKVQFGEVIEGDFVFGGHEVAG